MTLTERENDVLVLLTSGYTNKEIAERLNITHHTVKAHIGAILRKFGCKNRTDAAIFAERNNVIHLPD